MRKLLISFSGRTKQIFFLIIELEPWLFFRLQPRENNFVPIELDVSISAKVLYKNPKDRPMTFFSNSQFGFQGFKNYEYFFTYRARHTNWTPNAKNL